MIFASTKRECAASRFLAHRPTTHHHIANVYSLSSHGYFTRVFNRKEPYGTHSNCNQRSRAHRRLRRRSVEQAIE